MPRGVWFVGPLLLCAGIAVAAPAATLDFDEFPSGTALSAQYNSLGVILASTAPLGPSVSPDPADWLHPGEAVAPFVFAITAVPPLSTPTQPNKVIGAKYDAGGGLIQCARCGLRVEFLAPYPTEVSLSITDVDAGQKAIFVGAGGVLDVHVTQQPLGPHELVGLVSASGIHAVLLESAPGLGIGFDSLSFSGSVPEPAPIALLLGATAAIAVRPRRPAESAERGRRRWRAGLGLRPRGSSGP